MGRQSARIVRKGIDHKDIVGGKFNHIQLWHKGELVWEKLPDGDVYKGLELTSYVEYGNTTFMFKAQGDFKVDWGDGNIEEYHNNSLSYVIHSYSLSYLEKRYYDVFVSGNITDLSFTSATRLSAVKNALPPTLQKSDFSTMFAYLNSIDLTINSNLFKYCGGVMNFNNCFYNTHLREIPQGLFDNCVSARSLHGCFRNTYITAVPDRLFANLTALEDVGYCFNNCSALETVGMDIFSSCKSITNTTYLFGFAPIKRLEDGLFDDLENLEVAERMCWACTDLEYIPYTLFDNCEKLNNVIGAFYNCNAITSSLPPLWERDISVWGGTYANTRGCYYRCSNAENYKEAYVVGLFTSSIN